ncbi:MAG: NAD(P)/FAD-dependent oxidoreductase [Planctomycetes bacterium]|nr:NAD(P)/FAD-dependent oxidoreductase [Planctomycetota bacterium]
MYDVLIVGAGPAGATVATILAKRLHRVALVDQQKIPVPGPRAIWLGARTPDLLGEIDVSLDGVFENPVETVILHSADLSSRIQAPLDPGAPGPPAYLADGAAVNAGLVKAATAAGVELVPNTTITDVMLGEAHVELERESGSALRGRMLVGAWGAHSTFTSRVGVVPPSDEGALWAAEIEVDVEAPEFAGTKETDQPVVHCGPTAELILGLEDQGIGYVLRDATRLRIAVHARSASADMGVRLRQLCARLRQAGVIPVDLDPRVAGATVRRSSACAALEFDSHVGKHALVIGEAGGFVAGMSNEGVYPAMWSAKIAAEVMDEALSADSSQDHLMQFDTRWRTVMADYLRSPQTELQFLLPLIFSKEPMAVRMANAFFLGDNI